jgi:hypothetical protein
LFSEKKKKQKQKNTSANSIYGSVGEHHQQHYERMKIQNSTVPVLMVANG